MFSTHSVLATVLIFYTSQGHAQAGGTVRLDKIGDLSNDAWRTVTNAERCFYGESVGDLYYAWGCGGDPATANNDTGTNGGYWTACKMEFCRLPFLSQTFKPTTVVIRGTVAGDAKIGIVLKSHPEATEFSAVEEVTSGVSDLFQGEVTVDLPATSIEQVVEVRIYAAKGKGYVLLDEIVLMDDSAKSSATSLLSVLPHYALLWMALLLKY